MRRRVFAQRKQWQRGVMNKGETRYAEHLEALKQKGIVADYYFEGSTWLIGPNCRLTPDFTVFHADGEMQLHEVKAARRGKDGKERYHAEDDAKAKMKAFVDKYEMPLYVVWQERGKTYWTTEVIGG